MLARHVPELVIDNFLAMLRDIANGVDAYVPLDSVSEPDESRLLNTPDDPAQIHELGKAGKGLLERVVLIKLNGGRSTTMGGDVPKGILAAKSGRSYLEIVAGQVKAVEKQWGVRVPLVLMNSFFTHDATLGVIGKLEIPVRTFVQNQVPRLVADTLAPLQTGTEEDWAPPGHGDVYQTLRLSGLLDEFISSGRRWAFISNVDNLAATLEPWILGLIDHHGIDFLIEVTDRTESDRKGGTLVMRSGRLDLLEIAQVSPEDKDAFMDLERFPVFNTNNVWVDLRAVAKALDLGELKFPIIQNSKVVAGAGVIQLETAMGAAIGCFPAASGLRVSRDRFFPTKKVEDLFVLQSDACILDAMDRIRSNPLRPSDLPLRPEVIFGSDFLASPLEIQFRFEDPSSISMVKAESLEVQGPVFFERDVTIEGRVRVIARSGHTYPIRKGSTLRDALYSDEAHTDL